MNITEKVSPMHPDKIADRIAGAIVDYCYGINDNPKVAVEVLIGHGKCYIIAETNIDIPQNTITEIVNRISKEKVETTFILEKQDNILASNQDNKIRCGDNGIFAGYSMPTIHTKAYEIVKKLYDKYPFDGKILVNDSTNEITICWSNVDNNNIKNIIPEATLINPLGYWTGGINVDTGLTGRKLANDFYGISNSLGGGNMHGKDLSKTDVSVNIYCFLEAQRQQKEIKAICSIGDEKVNVNGEKIDYKDIVEKAKEYIKSLGGFEKFAEYGLIIK